MGITTQPHRVSIIIMLERWQIQGSASMDACWCSVVISEIISEFCYYLSTQAFYEQWFKSGRLQIIAYEMHCRLVCCSTHLHHATILHSGDAANLRNLLVYRSRKK